jgi:GT2 family glycosyltransferase
MSQALRAAAPRLCVLLSCFNRRALTLACLQALADSAARAGVQLHAVLMDDGSTDGTSDAVRQRFDWVDLLRGDGSLYWCRGMHTALVHALTQSHDHYLWLNDDTLLVPDALSTLLATATALRARSGGPVIVAGSTADPKTGAPTYGGRQRAAGWRRTRFDLVPPNVETQRIDTFDGNIVWLSAEAVDRVGNLDAAFEHAMGDTDYGLRAQRLGVGVWLAPGVLGHCPENTARGGFNDAALPWRQRWRAMLSRKGLPWRSWARFTRRHAGLAWPLYFAWPYARVLWSGLRKPRP